MVNQYTKVRYNRAKKYHKPFEVYTETFTCVWKDNGDPQYASDKYDWVVSVVDSFHSREEADEFARSLTGLEVV